MLYILITLGTALFAALINFVFPSNNYFLIGLIIGAFFMMFTVPKLNSYTKKIKNYKKAQPILDELTQSLSIEYLIKRLTLLIPMFILGVSQIMLGIQISNNDGGNPSMMNWAATWFLINTVFLFFMFKSATLPEHIENFKQK